MADILCISDQLSSCQPSICGTDNKIIERAVTISFPESGENQLTLFFGESGVRMDEILLVQE